MSHDAWALIASAKRLILILTSRDGKRHRMVGNSNQTVMKLLE